MKLNFLTGISKEKTRKENVYPHSPLRQKENSGLRSMILRLSVLKSKVYAPFNVDKFLRRAFEM